MYVLLFLAFFVNICFYEASPVIVKLPKGSVKGAQLQTSSTGKPYRSFVGIRYAEPPERFKPAVPIKPWSTVQDATTIKSACMQKLFFKDNAEDCLYINVYTPNFKGATNSRIAVMFWIHGGSFITGDGDRTYYAPDFFLDEDVILVTFNYRLGAFGFMNATNLGIKDAVVALQWVQENIQYFGGDPKKVTLFGESAGAVMVTYLMMSPLTEGKGYFQRAIAQGGNVLMPWTFNRNPEKISKSTLDSTPCALKKLVGFGALPVEECLKTVDSRWLVFGQTAVVDQADLSLDVRNGLPYTPGYEAPGPGAAITGRNIPKLKNNFPKIPFLMGVNSQESAFIDPLWLLIRGIYAQADKKPEFLVSPGFKTKDPKTRKKIGQKIKEFYFPKSSVSQSNETTFLTYLSDSQFNNAFLEYINLAKNKVPNYCYIFSYVGKNKDGAIGDLLSLSNEVPHSFELPFQFAGYDRQELTGRDVEFKNAFVRLWTNFAKYGNPTPTGYDEVLGNLIWPKSKVGKDIQCMVLDREMRIMKNPANKNYKFWKKLYSTYGGAEDTF